MITVTVAEIQQGLLGYRRRVEAVEAFRIVRDRQPWGAVSPMA
jgi:hypothetical protein